MHRLLLCAAVAASLLISACGQATTTADTAPSSKTVNIKHVDGMGDVLVDSSGLALYTPDQEANGKIRCTGECTSFWTPLEPGSGAPTGAKKLGVVKRPDGGRQVTLDGKPLYTFVEDAPGKITGDDFRDAFGGTRFTWHVVLAGGSVSSSSGGSGNESGGGYGY
jgi:predicted lipoprotein with Yx(FWY)xxD motif